MRGKAASKSAEKRILGKVALNGKLGRLTPATQPPKPVYILYRDHVLFRNSDPNLYKPSIRECVGWLQKEDEKAVWVVWDRSVKPLPYEKTDLKESGLIVLKADIIELKEVKLA